MGAEWRDCIVTMIDMAGVRDRAGEDASTLMRRFHALVIEEAPSLTTIAHTYVWNDSALLLSYVDGDDTFEPAIRDAEKLKRRIDGLANSYAIAIKGKAFPPAPGERNAQAPRNVTLIDASSWAMANCFLVEKALGKCKKPWYIDKRIAERIRTSQISQTHEVDLLPKGKPRKIHTFDGYLWETSGPKRAGGRGQRNMRHDDA